MTETMESDSATKSHNIKSNHVDNEKALALQQQSTSSKEAISFSDSIDLSESYLPLSSSQSNHEAVYCNKNAIYGGTTNQNTIITQESVQQQHRSSTMILSNSTSSLPEMTSGSGNNNTGSSSFYIEDRSSNLKIRIRAQESSNWTEEEMKLMSKWESNGSKKSRIHSRLAHRNENLSKWLRFFTGLVTTLSGGGSCVSFFVKLADGIVNYGELIFGIVAFLSGLTASIVESFGWHREAEEHKKSADQYRSIVSEIQMVRSNLKLDRRDCEFWISRLTYQTRTADDDAPYIEKRDFYYEETLQEKKRSNSIWSAEGMV